MAEESNRQLYVLSILSALFLPPTFITGMFGMNVKGLPFADDPRGFGVVIGLPLASAAATYGVIRVSAFGRHAADLPSRTRPTAQAVAEGQPSEPERRNARVWGLVVARSR